MKTGYVSRRKAAEILDVSATVVDRICLFNKVSTYQVPGHNRKLYLKSDLLELVKRSTGGQA